MARARIIKPSLFMNEILGTADPLLTLLLENLWIHGDREGRLEDRPLHIKAVTFPYRDADVNAMLSWLSDNRFIDRYAVDDRKYIQIIDFRKYQTPHPTEKPSAIPPRASTEQKRNVPEVQRRKSEQDPLTTSPATGNFEMPTDSLSPHQEECPDTTSEGGVPKDDFEEYFWQHWPKPGGKKAARKLWKELAPNAELRFKILADVVKHALGEPWQKERGKYVPHPTTYLDNWLKNESGRRPIQTNKGANNETTAAGFDSAHRSVAPIEDDGAGVAEARYGSAAADGNTAGAPDSGNQDLGADDRPTLFPSACDLRAVADGLAQTAYNQKAEISAAEV
jgi:hypothetical protein